MKKNAIGIICCCFFFAVPAVCLGATGWYGGVKAGVAMASDSDLKITGLPTVQIKYDTGYTVGGAIGYIMEKFRLEGELSYQANDVDSIAGVSLDLLGESAEVTALTFLANGYWDFDAGGGFTPYLTAGIGATKVELEVTGGGSEDDTVFAYQLGVGVGFALSETVLLDLGYRYLGAADAEFTDGSDKAEVEIGSHNFLFGLRFVF
jgi:opacity protein-like surface antigen